MKPNFKFHMTALLLICLAITAIYYLLTPNTPTAPVAMLPKSGHAIEIYSASWGENCTAQVEQELLRRQQTLPVKDAAGNPVKLPVIIQAAPNNVMDALKKACNGKERCELQATSDAFGLEIMAGCFKKLVTNHRCFSYDRLWETTTEQGKTLTIDCSDAKDAATSPTTPNAAAPAAHSAAK